MKTQPSDLIRRNGMAHSGANYECKRCGAKLSVGRDMDYTERDQKAADEHGCQGAK